MSEIKVFAAEEEEVLDPVDVGADGEWRGVAYGLAAAQGGRRTMEDRHVVCADPGEDLGLFAVFDGHLGSSAAQFCAEYLPDYVYGRARDLLSRRQYEQALRQTFVELDFWLKPAEVAWPFPVFAGMDPAPRAVDAPNTAPLLGAPGTTALACLVAADELVVANAGDCRAILAMRNGTCRTLTTDHHPDLPGEGERAMAAGMELVRGGTAILSHPWCIISVSRALGDWQFKNNLALGSPDVQALVPHPDVAVVPRTGQEAFLLLVSDGVTNSFADADACDLVRDSLESGYGPSATCQRLLEACRQGGDNKTALLLVFPPGTAPPAP